MHNIIFIGNLVSGFELSDVKANLSKLFNIDDAQKIDRLFSGKPVTLKKDLDADKAKKYHAALRKAGADCRIEPPLESVVSTTATDDVGTSTASMNFNTLVASSVTPPVTPSAASSTETDSASEASQPESPYQAPEASAETLSVNDSGRGKEAVLPAEAMGLCWGAFFLNWIWGIFNRVYIALLTLIPVVGFFVMIWLLFSGRRLAWQNKQWDSVEHFNSVQKKWGIAGLTIFIAIIGLYAFAIISALHSLDQLSEAAQSENAEFEQMLDETEDPEMREAMRNLNELMKQAEAEAEAYDAREQQ